MLYVFYGNDAVRVRQAALAKLDACLGGEGEPQRIESESYVEGALAAVLGGVSLFGEVVTCLLDTPSGSEEMAQAVRERLSDLAASTNHFVVIEGALLAADRKVYEKHAATMDEYKAEATPKGNPFALGDAFAARDKKTLWLLLVKELESGAAPEAVAGLLWWQLKTIRLAALTKNAAEAGMNEFPYKKAQGALRKYSLEEIEQLAHKLLVLYHDAHAGKGDMARGLEKWCLGV